MLLSRRTLLFIAGTLWLLTGITFLTWGIFFIMQSTTLPPSPLSLVDLFSGIVKKSESALIVLTMGLYLGYLVGRFSISKQVEREAKRLSLLPAPLSLRYLFSRKTLFLFLLLIAICLLFWTFQTYMEMSGFFNLVIGSTLINGGVTYLRKAIIFEDL